MTTTVAAHRAQERWFVGRGLPSVLTQRARLRAIWPCSAPFLAFTATSISANRPCESARLASTLEVAHSTKTTPRRLQLAECLSLPSGRAHRVGGGLAGSCRRVIHPSDLRTRTARSTGSRGAALLRRHQAPETEAFAHSRGDINESLVTICDYLGAVKHTCNQMESKRPGQIAFLWSHPRCHPLRRRSRLTTAPLTCRSRGIQSARHRRSGPSA